MNYSNFLTSGRISKIGLFDFRGVHMNLYSARGGGGGAPLRFFEEARPCLVP